jgi:hypothetical protein
MSCKLCNGVTKKMFNLMILDKYQGEYYVCINCGSLQISDVHWLEEAYGTGNLSSLDHGVMQRNLDNFCMVYFFSKIFSVKKILDFGGGTGILTRLLRDYGLDSFFSDRHVTHSVAPSFNSAIIVESDLRLAFEVLEHFINPAQDLNLLFDKHPKYIIISTELYANQGSDWPYLVPQSGQHIFFYSKKAMEFIAKKNGYKYLNVGGYGLFYRARRNIYLVKLVFTCSVIFMRPLRLLLFLLSPKGVQVDVQKTKK